MLSCMLCENVGVTLCAVGHAKKEVFTESSILRYPTAHIVTPTFPHSIQDSTQCNPDYSCIALLEAGARSTCSTPCASCATPWAQLFCFCASGTQSLRSGALVGQCLRKLPSGKGGEDDNTFTATLAMPRSRNTRFRSLAPRQRLRAHTSTRVVSVPRGVPALLGEHAVHCSQRRPAAISPANARFPIRDGTT